MNTNLSMEYPHEFFATARERYRIMLNKNAGLPREQWTADQIYRDWRFCNVRREDDRTTVWFREKVRLPLMQMTQAPMGLRSVQAAVAFRWFNRIETGERVLNLLLHGWDSRVAKELLDGVAPVVTGAYIIKGLDGMSKLDGICACIDKAFTMLPGMLAKWNTDRVAGKQTLRAAWADLLEVPYLGRFMAYELVSDLRWDVLDAAIDINTWANAGPGCTRGLGRVVNGTLDRFSYGSNTSQAEMLVHMQELLRLSRDPENWPAEWPAWEMREVEHWLCEFDKYKRVQGGERMKRRYP